MYVEAHRWQRLVDAQNELAIRDKELSDMRAEMAKVKLLLREARECALAYRDDADAMRLIRTLLKEKNP